MKKAALCAALALIVFAVFTPNCSAANIDEYYADRLEESGAKELAELLDGDTRDYLERIGCGDMDFASMLDPSPRAIFALMAEITEGCLKAPLAAAFKAVAAVMLVSVCSGFFPNDERSRAVMGCVCGCFVLLSIFSQGISTLKAGVSAISACAAFEKALIPVLAAALTASGSPAAAVSVQGAAFAAAQVITALSEDFFLPLIGITAALGTAGAMLPTLRLSAVGELIRKSVSSVLGICAALFSGLLSVKCVIAGSADSLTARGVKLAANTFVPVVGGALSEAYSSVIGSIALMKSAVGVYGIAALFFIAAPSAVQLALWALAMRAASAVAELLGCAPQAEMLKNIGYVFAMTNTLLILCAAVLMISAGAALVIKGNC